MDERIEKIRPQSEVVHLKPVPDRSAGGGGADEDGAFAGAAVRALTGVLCVLFQEAHGRLQKVAADPGFVNPTYTIDCSCSSNPRFVILQTSTACVLSTPSPNGTQGTLLDESHRG